MPFLFHSASAHAPGDRKISMDSPFANDSAADVDPRAMRAAPRRVAGRSRRDRRCQSRRRSSQILATWQAKVPWKEILLLLAAAMSTLRHVEPPSLRDATPSTPRDADLKLSATRRPPRRMTPT